MTQLKFPREYESDVAKAGRDLIEEHVREALTIRHEGLAYLAARCLSMWDCRPDEMELVEEHKGGAIHWHFRRRPGQSLGETNERSD